MMNGKDYKGMYMKRFGKFLPYSVLRTLYGEGGICLANEKMP